MNYEAKWGVMVNASDQISKCAVIMKSVSGQATQIKNSLYLTGSPYVLQKLKSELQNCITLLDTCSCRTTALKNLLSDSANMYKANERKLAESSPQSNGYLSNTNNSSDSTSNKAEFNSTVIWSSILKLLGQFGFVGSLINTAGSIAQNDSESIGKGLLGVLGEGAKLVGTMMGQTNKVSAFGFAKTVDAIGFAENLAMKFDGYIINNSYNANNLSAAQKTANNISAYAKWGGIALTAVGSFVSNVKKYDSDFSNPRIYAETAVGTTVSVLSGIVIGAGVAAVAGATAPVWAVGVVSVLISLVIDGAFQAVTGQGMAEFISEKVVDGVEAIGEAVGDGIAKAGKAVASWFSKPLIPKLSW